MDALIGSKSVKNEMPEFSALQKDIIRLMQTGLSTKEILLLTHSTHEEMTVQRNIILGKTHCSNMFDVVSRADKYNWF